jgi:AcrR family transcriptional regulator
MARVNLTRRAEIGYAKRTRTRATILDAARQCYANGAVTVDAVMQAAGLAKGTFYVHFEDLPSLEAELGATLIAELDERLQPARLAVSDPLTRLATATTILLCDLASAPARARLAAHAVDDIPIVSRGVLVRLREDLAAAQAAGCLALPSSGLAARIVSAIVLQAARDLGLGRIDAKAVPDIVRAVLRAIGCAPDDAATHTAEAVRNADEFAQQQAAAGGTDLAGG